MKFCVNLQYSFFLLKIVILQQHFQTVSTSNANAIIREAPEKTKDIQLITHKLINYL